MYRILRQEQREPTVKNIAVIRERRWAILPEK